MNSFFTNIDLPMIHFPFAISQYHYAPRTVQMNILTALVFKAGVKAKNNPIPDL